MRSLFPRPADDLDLVEAYAIPTDAAVARPFVRCNMISTLDGAVTVNGRSALLGGPADRRVFKLLRSLSDVVLVGSGTVRAEHYGPPRLHDHLRDLRVGRGQSPVPPMAIVTRSGNLDWSTPLFTQAEQRPIVFTTEDGYEAAGPAATEVAELVVAGDDTVGPLPVLEDLHARGWRSVLLEGGPTLNADFVHAGLLDELCLTLSPRMVAGDGPRVLAGAELPQALDLDLVHLLEEDGFLFLRLTVRSERNAT